MPGISIYYLFRQPEPTAWWAKKGNIIRFHPTHEFMSFSCSHCHALVNRYPLYALLRPVYAQCCIGCFSGWLTGLYGGQEMTV